MEDWNSPIYAFFHPVLTVWYHDGQHYHEFHALSLLVGRLFVNSWIRKTQGLPVPYTSMQRFVGVLIQ